MARHLTKASHISLFYFHHAVSTFVIVDVGDEATFVLVEVAVVGIGAEAVIEVFVAGVVFGAETAVTVDAAVATVVA